jgi:hypothetical protein
MRPFMWTFGLLVLTTLVTAQTQPTYACGNGKLILEDKFETLDPAWGFAPNDPKRSNGSDGLVYKLNPNQDIEILNQSDFYDNYEVCAVITTKVPANAYAPVGLFFWSTDLDNYYAAFMDPAAGKYGVIRSVKGKTLIPVALTPSDAVHKGTDVTNEISVSVKANKATIAINGKEVIDFNGVPPEGGSIFGFEVDNDKGNAGPATFILKSIQLREVEGAPQSSQPPTSPPPTASAQQPPITSGQPGSGTEATGPQSPSTPAQAPASPPPSTSSAGSAAKPMPSIEGVTVALGDARDSVAKAYPAATDIGAGNLAIASDGIKFFFSDKDPKVLREIMVEEPYKGSVNGIKLGATADDVSAQFGKPDDIRPVFGGSGYVYFYAGGNFLRYDVDEKSKKVTDIVQMLSGK